MNNKNIDKGHILLNGDLVLSHTYHLKTNTNKGDVDMSKPSYSMGNTIKGSMSKTKFMKKIQAVDTKEITIGDEVCIMNKKYTRLRGGFSDNNIMITDKQLGEMLGYKKPAKQVRDIVNDNKLEFQNDLHIIDMKVAVSKGNLKQTLIDTGYDAVAIGRAKNIYGFSRAGILKYSQFAKGKKASKLFDNFIESYFELEDKVEKLQERVGVLENINVEALNSIEELTISITEAEAILNEVSNNILENSDDKQKITNILQEKNKTVHKLIDLKVKQESLKLIKRLEPELLMVERLMGYDEEIFSVGLLSKVMGIRKLGRNNLYKFLRDNKYLYLDNGINVPYQGKLQYFKIKPVKTETYEGFKLMIRMNGVKHILKELIKAGHVEVDIPLILERLNNTTKPITTESEEI